MGLPSCERRWQAGQALATAAILALACVGNVGCKEGNPLASAIDPADAVFEATLPPPEVTSRFVTLEASSIAEGRICLDLVVHDVDEPVTGIAVKLTYPYDISRFLGCLDGNVYPSGDCMAREWQSGELILARNEGGPTEATAILGDQVMLRVEFLVFAEGQGDVRFEAQNIGGSDATALLDVNGDPIFTHWYSGTLVGR